MTISQRLSGLEEKDKRKIRELSLIGPLCCLCSSTGGFIKGECQYHTCVHRVVSGLCDLFCCSLAGLHGQCCLGSLGYGAQSLSKSRSEVGHGPLRPLCVYIGNP